MSDTDHEEEEFYECPDEEILVNENQSEGRQKMNSVNGLVTTEKVTSLNSRPHIAQSSSSPTLQGNGQQGNNSSIPSSTQLLNSGRDHNRTRSSGGDAELSVWGGRTALPAQMFDRNDFSIWSILRHCIGMELSKITMPVIFNEPLSFLQRVVEYMEYLTLLKRASDSNDPIERHELITAFAVSAAASNWERIGKPFNPLLGETYELERPDLGFRIVCEQVSHHPPVSAFHMDSPLYTFHGCIHPKLKFWGKSVEVTPKGLVTLYLKRHDEAYSWQNVNCCVHNVIVGKLWIEHYGAMEVTNHKTKYRSVLNFLPCGWFGRDLHKVEGFLFNEKKQKVKAFYGKWVDSLFSCNVDIWDEFSRSVGNASSRHAISTSVSVPEMSNMTSSNDRDVPDEIPVRSSTCDLNLPTQRLLWVAAPKPPNSSCYYSFTSFAMLLNEFNDGLRARIAPTDSRYRPDMRKMEEGLMDASGEEKNRIEEKQRAARKERKKKKDELSALWFKPGVNPHTKKDDWLFTGDYWRRDWSNCPDIF